MLLKCECCIPVNVPKEESYMPKTQVTNGMSTRRINKIRHM